WAISSGSEAPWRKLKAERAWSSTYMEQREGWISPYLRHSILSQWVHGQGPTGAGNRGAADPGPAHAARAEGGRPRLPGVRPLETGDPDRLRRGLPPGA